MRVFVAGATGTLGRPTIAALRRAGHEVRGLARDQARAGAVAALGAEPVVGDLFDTAAMRAAVADCDAVLHLATRIPAIARMRRRGAWDENDRIRRDGARVLVDAALARGVGRYVQESITFVYADGGDRWLDETAPIDAAGPLASAVDAEQSTAHFGAGGGAGIVLRFGLFYAPYAPSTRDTVALARRRLFTIIGGGEQYVSAIHVDDAASAVVAALELPTGIYNVVDDEPLPMREYARALTRAFGFRPPFRIPRVLARLVLGRSATVLLRSQRVANRTFVGRAGWKPRYPSVREGWAAVAGELAGGR